MTFSIGDKVVYPHHGAATVEKREKRKLEIDGKQKNVEYLVMRVAYTDLVVRVPTERIDEIGIREVINPEEVEEVFAVIMKTDARTPSNWSRRFKNHIEKLKSGDIYQVAEVVHNLSSRDGDKGLSAGEKRMLSQARNILTSELSYALDLDREGAEETLNKVLNKEDVSDIIAAKKKTARAAKKAKAEKKKAQEAKAKERAAAKAKAAPKKTTAKTTAKKPAKTAAKSAKKPSPKKATKTVKKKVSMSATSMFTIVVAAGSSTRFGTNKLDQVIGEETVLERSVRIAKENSNGVILVVSDISKYKDFNVDSVVLGGKTRTQSVRNGLRAIPNDVDIIAVHDAARPFANNELYDKGKALIQKGNAGAVPAIEVTDTIKENNNGNIKTLDRSKLYAIQTPQIFNAKILRIAYEQDIDDTDDAALVEALGEKITLFEGSADNRKITTRSDMKAASSNSNIMRIGVGYDIHPFSSTSSKKLILGGIQFDYLGLEGHSDSDAVLHSLTDAILSAIGSPDLGTLYPANDEKNKNVGSAIFLTESVKRAFNDGFIISNASIIINAQEPKLIEHIDEMKKIIREILEPICDHNTQISITPKHGEGVGAIGNSEAISVYCPILLIAQAS